MSRNTTVFAYEQLLAEGYVEAKVGSGTCVARSLPDELLSVGTAVTDVGYRPSSRRTISARASCFPFSVAAGLMPETDTPSDDSAFATPF